MSRTNPLKRGMFPAIRLVFSRTYLINRICGSRLQLRHSGNVKQRALAPDDAAGMAPNHLSEDFRHKGKRSFLAALPAPNARANVVQHQTNESTVDNTNLHAVTRVCPFLHLNQQLQKYYKALPACMLLSICAAMGEAKLTRPRTKTYPQRGPGT